MKKNVKIEIKNEKESAHDFIDAWHMAEKGKLPKKPTNRIVFQNLETLLSTLTPPAWTSYGSCTTRGI